MGWCFTGATVASTIGAVTTTVPALEFRRHMAEYLDETRSGRSFEITRGGRPAARLVPPAAFDDEETASDD
jgi:prevent-host-death family protein